MQEERDLEKRTRMFAVEVIKFVQTLPRNTTCDIIGRQLLRAATSVGANYLEAKRARSPADFISKMTITETEAAECHYWIQLLSETHNFGDAMLQRLRQESDELTAIFTASGKTAKNRYGKK